MMAERIVHVTHPCPMVVRRKRKRTPERRFAALVTPVSIRTVRGDDIGPPLRIAVGDLVLTWRVFEGALWYEVAGTTLGSRARTPWDRFGPTQFIDFLEGRLGWSDVAGTDLGAALLRTPLLAVCHDLPAPSRGMAEEGRGPDAPRLPIAEILVDGREAAARDLRGFMDERVLIAGEAVLVRSYDPLFLPGRDGPLLQPFPQAIPLRQAVGARVPLGHRIDAFEAALDWERHAGPRWPGTTRPWLAALAGAPFGSDTALLLAGLAVVGAHEAFVEMAKRYPYFLRHPGSRAQAEAVEEAVGEARDWADRAGSGRISLAEAPAVVAAAERLARALAECYEPRRPRTERVREVERLVRRFQEFEWPLATVHPMSEEDAAALTELMHDID